MKPQLVRALKAWKRLSPRERMNLAHALRPCTFSADTVLYARDDVREALADLVDALEMELSALPGVEA